MSKKKQINRRSFIAAAGAASVFDPVAYIAQAFLNKKYGLAQAAPTSDKRYVFIQQRSAPARWVFDLFVNPRNQGNFLHNPHMGTQYSVQGGRYTGVEYKLININGTHVPPIWDVNLPAPGNQTRKLKSLLRNMVSIQGMSTGNAAHPFCSRLHMQPLGAPTTITSLTAGGGGSPMPAIDFNTAEYAYADKAGLLPVKITTNGNKISELMEAFDNPMEGNAFAAKEAALKAEIDAAQDAVNEALGERPGMRTAKQSSESAQAIMERNFPDFNTEWTRLRDKYRNLVGRALRNTTYLGVNNRPIGVGGQRGNEYQHNNRIETKADLRDLIGPNTNINGMADQFAAMEFVMQHDLSRSVACRIGGIRGLVSSVQNSQVIDEHGTGAMMTLFLNTHLYGALGACLLEFVQKLKDFGVYEETVVDVSGEFNRIPKSNMEGSDHGHRGASTAMYTGQVTTGPFIMGDLVRNDGGNRYGGTWGAGGSNAALGGIKLGVGHFASTVATLLESPSPVTAASSLVERKPDGSIAPLVPRTKIVGS